MVMAVGIQGLKAGDICPDRRSFRTRRRWWYRRYAVTVEQLGKEEFKNLSPEAKRHLKSEGGKPVKEAVVEQPAPEPVEEVVAEAPELEDDVVAEETEAGELVAVSAEEGGKGWWDVTYSDGSSKKMRRSDVEELGLLEDVDGEAV